MGCCADLLLNETERKNEENMNRIKVTEINAELDGQNKNIENQNNKNEDIQIFQKKKINLLYKLKDEEIKAPITKNNLDESDKSLKNEEKNLNKIKEDDINNKKEIKEKDQLKFDKDLCKSIA